MFSLSEIIMIIPDITKTASNNCFIIHWFKESNDKHIAVNTVYFRTVTLILFCRVAPGVFLFNS